MAVLFSQVTLLIPGWFTEWFLSGSLALNGNAMHSYSQHCYASGGGMDIVYVIVLISSGFLRSYCFLSTCCI